MFSFEERQQLLQIHIFMTNKNLKTSVFVNAWCYISIRNLARLHKFVGII